MLVYLFQRNGDQALTIDITGRNLPPPNRSSRWVLVEALDTQKFEPRRRDIAEIDDMLRLVKAVGYYLF
jgi:hypothetical protein